MKRLAYWMVTVVAVTAMGQDAKTGVKSAGASVSAQQKVASDAPSLADTEQWIKNTLAENSGTSFCHEFDSSKQPGSEYGMEYACIKQTYSLDFEGCKVTLYTFHSHDGYRLTHDPVAYGGDDKERNSIVTFNLGDIDPKTIQAGAPYGAFGPLNKKTFHYNPAQSEVCFATTDSKNAMTLIFPYSSRHESFKEHELCESNQFFTVNPDYATRFVKALTHAVELCGGKTSAF